MFFFFFVFLLFGFTSEQRGESGVGFSWLASKVVIRSLFFFFIIINIISIIIFGFLDFLVKAKSKPVKDHSWFEERSAGMGREVCRPAVQTQTQRRAKVCVRLAEGI